MKLVTIGDNVIDIYADQSRGFVGGNCVNVAVYARRAGAAETAYFGVVGDDERGGDILRALREEGVAVSGVSRTPGPTAWCRIAHEHGDRVFVASDKGVSLFRVDDGLLESIAGFDVAHMAYSGQMEDDVEKVSAVVPVSFDFSDRHSPEYIGAIAPFVTYAEFSAGGLDETGCRQLAARAQAAGARNVLITRGADGALFWAEDGMRHRVAARRIPVVDTLGAGDSFIATFLVGMLSGAPVDRVLEDATAHAARTCAAVGGFGPAIDLAPADLFVPSTTHTTERIEQ